MKIGARSGLTVWRKQSEALDQVFTLEIQAQIL